MKMKHIKLLKEFFDTDELKAEFEIPTITGDLNFKELSKDAPEFFKRDKTALGIHDKLTLEFPFLDFCIYGNKEGCGSDTVEIDGNEVIRYMFMNKEFDLGLSVNKDLEYYVVTLYYKYADVQQTDENLIICEGPFDADYIDDLCICEVYAGGDINDVIDIIRDNLIPLMEDFGFKDILNDVDALAKRSMMRN